jgi:tetratricopeptide (TPR) repeat protein
MKTIRISIFCVSFCILFSCGSDELKTAQIQNITGLELYEKGDYKKSLYFFLKAANHTDIPDSNKAIYFDNIAHAYFHTSQPDSAKFFYKKVCQLAQSNRSDCNISLANLLLLDDKIDSARSLLEEIVAKDSTNGAVNNLLGLIYIGDYGQAFFNPELGYKFNNRAYWYFRDAGSKFALAKNEYFLNNTEKAIALFSQLHQQFPKNEGYLVSLILMKGEKGDRLNFDRLLRELKKRFPQQYGTVVSQINPGSHSLRWNL